MLVIVFVIRVMHYLQVAVEQFWHLELALASLVLEISGCKH